MSLKVLLLLFLARYATSGSVYDLVIDAVICPCDRSTHLDVSKLKLYTYNFETNVNSSCLLNETDTAVLGSPNFDPEQCMHIFIPGFENNINSTPPNVVRCALANYICNSKKIVLGIIDHSDYLSGNTLESINYVGVYEKAVAYSTSVSIAIGNFIASLLKVLDKDKVMASGHSLGGQMVGQAAEQSKRLGYPMGKILAMDPAGPCFETCPNQHIKSGQADTVLAIHCNAGELGSNLNLTDYDAYSGNGVTQIGCNGGNAVDLIIKSEASSCSHSKCVPIAMQTALHSDIWNAIECSSYEAYNNGACDNNSEMVVNYRVYTNSSEGVYYFKPTVNLTCTA